jgi:hypothetical protein
MSPPFPPVAEPDDNVRLPVVPPLEVPVENVNTPLVPAAPAFSVLATIAPLSVAVLLPLDNDRLPPAADADVLPAVTDICPPTPVLPAPPSTTTSPPLPPTAAPVAIEIFPEDPVVLAPV